MSHLLNSTEIESLLLFYLENKMIDKQTLLAHLENSSHWYEELICLTFSFARVLERRRKSVVLTQKMIPELFSMPEKMSIDIQECDEDFVDYMLRDKYSEDDDLEQALLTVARNLSERSHGKKMLRY